MPFSPVNPTATTGAQILASTYNITAANGVFVSSGLSITLPEAGKYLIVGDILNTIQASSGTNAYIGLQLYNATDGAFVPGTLRFGAYSFTATIPLISNTSIHKIVTVTASKVITVYCSRNNGSAYTISRVDQDQTELSYIKLA